MIVGYKKPSSERIIFLYGFEKSSKENISKDEKTLLSSAAKTIIDATDKKIKDFLNDRIIEEVHNE